MFSEVTVLEDSELESNQVTKFVFTSNTKVAESVLYGYPDFQSRTVMCISTQSGCPVGCVFCGAGDSFVGNLSAEEIVHQVETCEERVFLLEGTKLKDVNNLQIMFMSMGEPFLNIPAVIGAIKHLSLRYPNAKLLVSTIGTGAAHAFSSFINISVDIPNIGLQFSVHESNDLARSALIPMKNKMSLEEISLAGHSWSQHTGRRPFFNYCVHGDNNSDKNIDELYALFNPEVWECTLSVVCEKDQTVKDSIDSQLDLIQDFNERMVSRGWNTRVFNPAGQDTIGGGCGQLWHYQDWISKNKELVYNIRPKLSKELVS